MVAQITSIRKQISYHTNGTVYLITFRDEEGKSRRSWIDPNNGNFARWQKVIQLVNNGSKPTLIDLVPKGKNLINADSIFKVIS